ncbi:virulence factor SrfB [Gluconobacter sp. Dm-74]|uniref:virulence factor SrfB n=1 Tax=Gluconobacter sp. Dm-74 TaxID=2799803 RepID=UPI001B8CF961|nr:virulence factor SrfB [Gluconobacter sp. Dm-74]MBS1092471.1 virulence factor SrfB [Gluconobacter sp. Dm-74]
MSGNLISLIPNSLIQFETHDLDAKGWGNGRVSFWEEPSEHNASSDATDAPEFTLRMLERDPDTGDMVFFSKGRLHKVPDDCGYAIGRKDVFEMFENQWVPLPFLAIIGDGDRESFRPGPSNWVRGRLRRTEDPDTPEGEKIFLNIAFDTTLASSDENSSYLAPTAEDESREQRYAFVSEPHNISWLLDSDWLKDWISELYRVTQSAIPKRRRPRTDDEDEQLPVLKFQAIYQTFLKFLSEATPPLPDVRLLSIKDQKPVDVDLVLDLGNFRSCGILIEEHPGEGRREADSYVLELRDLASPDLTYSDPFSSRIEFGRALFGYDIYSRRSGRPHAFSWPSPVRTGLEAERMMGARIGTEGLSGLATPKRYLWDTRPSDQGWRFNNGKGATGQISDPPVNGPFRRMLAETLEKGRYRAAPEDRKAVNPIGPGVMSRSLLFVLMLNEVLVQAMAYMNAPGFRSRRRDSGRARRLRSVMLTMPPGMPVAEQRVFRIRAEAAISFAWKAAQQSGPQPALRAGLDEATATQIVWLHNEVTQRLGGHVEALFELYGQPTAEGEKPAIRVASIDIGGGTTDLMITTYTLEGGDALSPRQEFRESFNIAGDNLLERVIATVVIPPLEAALTKAGVPLADQLLNRALSKDHGNQDEKDRHRRKLFVSTVLEPAALHALELYEQIDNWQQGPLGSFPLGDETLRKADADQRTRCVAFLHEQIAAHLQDQTTSFEAKSFDPFSIEIQVDTETIDRAIRSTLETIISSLTESVWAYNCDVLLLSGRPSKLRRVRSLITGAMPVAPHRIIAMHDYTVGKHYPFSDSLNRINDPKTTVVVGAALCVQAEGKLQNFVLRTKSLAMRSTARFIGKMDKSSEIRNVNMLLENVDLGGPPAGDEVGFCLKDFGGSTMIGFRQLPLERWTTSALYCVEFDLSQQKHLAECAMPLTVTLERKFIEDDEDESGDFSNREMFEITRITDANDEDHSLSLVKLRLQTTLTPEGHWRDTGCLILK